MNSNDVRNMIERKLAEEKNTHAYFDVIRTKLDQTQAQEVFDFTANYLHNSVKLMDQVYAALLAANCLPMFQPIFDAALNYWSEEYDYVPYHLGIAGICDDAYLSMKLMQLVANSNIPSTNQVLMPGINNDLEDQNHFMAYLLGPPIANQLDQVANQTYQSIYIQDTLNNLLSAAGVGSLFAGGSMAMMHNALEQNRIDEQVNTQLGAMGIF
ncbi:MAG: hypothetical protein O6852_07645 [Gammaproteobacteria bacterium]|nr:hypothetical protein [Gammaproteobacteria bacterium]